MFGIAAPGGGQRVTGEWSVGATVTLARRDFYGAALGWSVRPGMQGRMSVGAAGGVAAGAAAVRVEGTAQFVLNPVARTGATLYAGVGAAFLGAAQAPGRGYATALVGVEAASGPRRVWFVEVGAGGGLRLAGGWRWRRLSGGGG